VRGLENVESRHADGAWWAKLARVINAVRAKEVMPDERRIHWVLLVSATGDRLT
jgi:hypothetical protein